MSRFYINVKNKPRVIVGFTEDLKETFVPKLEQFFGTAFLLSLEKRGDILHYEFDADEYDFDTMADAIKAYADSKIVKDIDINIDLN